MAHECFNVTKTRLKDNRFALLGLLSLLLCPLTFILLSSNRRIPIGSPRELRSEETGGFHLRNCKYPKKSVTSETYPSENGGTLGDYRIDRLFHLSYKI